MLWQGSLCYGVRGGVEWTKWYLAASTARLDTLDAHSISLVSVRPVVLNLPNAVTL